MVLARYCCPARDGPVRIDSRFSLGDSVCCIQVGHFAWRSLSAFSVQLRIAYLGLLVLALWPPLQIVYWIQLIGTSAMVLFDYCLLARVLSLLPWNPVELVSLGLLRRTFLSPPFKGNVLRGAIVQKA
ncbi:MAG: hypothetical protein ACE5LB_14305 [Acidiferrobacterales bacterium]